MNMLTTIRPMWHLCLILCLHTLLSASSDLPVCIVGAGPSGLSAAHSLEAIGRKTIIFEEQNAVGGRAQNYYENGLSFHLGPLLVSNGSHPETMRIVDAVNVPVISSASATNWLFNWTTGETWAAPSETDPALALQFVEELRRYAQQWEIEYEPFASNLYINGVPDNLTVSTAEWFSREKYPLLQSRFIQRLTAWGYGDANEVPILYTLSIFSPASLEMNPFVVDLHEVFERYSRQLTNTDIYLGSRIEHVDRSQDNITIHFTSQNTSSPSLLETRTCSDIILAFPPTTTSLHHAGLDLSPAEWTVFSAVETSNYFAAALRLNIPQNSSFNVAAASPILSADVVGEPVFVQNMYVGSDVAVAYSLAAPGQSIDDVKRVSLQTLSRINRDPRDDGETAAPVGLEDIEAFRHYPVHYPHFNATTLRQGFYGLFQGTQGFNRTYYTSGLNRVEHVEYAIQAARELVNAHFTS